MYRLDIDQNNFTLSWSNDKKATEKPVLQITKDEHVQTISYTKHPRTKICEDGLIPTSAIYKQTQKVTLESDGVETITVERIEESQPHNPWPNKWTFKLRQGDVIRTFRAPTPDVVLAYEYYFHQIKMDILRGQLTQT